jgi:RHS repeat-associated protein
VTRLIRIIALATVAGLSALWPACASANATLTVSGAESQRMDQSWDIGPLQIAISVSNYQFVETIYYGQYSTPASVASQIAGAFSRDYLQNGLCAIAKGTVVTFHLKNSATFGLVTIAGSTDSFQLYPSGFGSYNWTPPSSTGSTFVNTVYMAGGTDAGTYYDEGTISVRVGGAEASVDYTEGSTPSDLASELASEINTAASGMVNASASGGRVTVKSAEGGPSSDLTISGSITPTNTNYTGSTSFSMVTTDMSGGAVTSGDVLYSFTIPDNGGYDVNGNLLTAADSVMGQWNYSYDNLNRLTMASAPATQPAGLDHYYAGVNSSGQQTWFYDAFGNRLSETWGSGGTATFTASPNLSFSATSNQVTVVNGQNVLYDAAGNVTWDGYNSYLYDAEGRLCAVDSTRNLSSANPGMFGYIYGADGIRVAKGTISPFTCDFNPSDTNYNHFIVKTSWVLGAGGEQVTEYSVSGGTSTWVHSNAFGDGKLLATYRDTNTYFALEDWLGSKRAEISADNSCGTAFRSLPYGNGLTLVTLAGYTSSCIDATEHHFTGKERDAESGNDYFGARYYASTMGRWLSPDWSEKQDPIPYGKLDNPQSLNLYTYLYDNPLNRIDVDGHGELWDKFKAMFYAKVTGGVGVKAELHLTKNYQAGIDAFAGVEKKFSSEGSETKLKAEIGGGLKAPYIPLKPTLGIEKQVATNGELVSQPAEVYGDNPLKGEFGPASANSSTISLALTIPVAEGVSSGGGEIGIDVDKAVDFGKAVVDNLNAGASSLLNYIAPSLNTSDPQATPKPLPTPATRGQLQP